MNQTDRELSFRTRAIHVGNEQDPVTGAVVAPVTLASTFVLPGPGVPCEYDYSRTKNPTRFAFETTISNLESGVGALAYASGMAAIHGVLMMLKPGDHIVTGVDIYGGLYRILHKIMAQLEITTTMVPVADLNKFESAITDKTKLVWIEPFGNPLLSVADLRALSTICQRKNVILACDNTLLSPALCRPLELGVDIVMHSATKYIGGHSDLLGGVVTTNKPELLKRMHQIQNAVGNVMNPLDAYLCSRGLKTLDLRVREQSRSAMHIAQFLASHPKVKRVYYPGLPTHPGHDVAKSQTSGGFGSILSFEMNADLDTTKRFVTQTKLFRLAVSLGAVESLIAQCATMSHAGYDPATRRANGIADGLVRLSVGLEDVADLQADLESALGEVG